MVTLGLDAVLIIAKGENPQGQSIKRAYPPHGFRQAERKVEMIVKIIQGRREDLPDRLDEYLFECTNVNVGRLKCESWDKAVEMVSSGDGLVIMGPPHKDASSAIEVLQLNIDEQSDNYRQIHVAGQAVVFVCNNEGRTVDRYMS